MKYGFINIYKVSINPTIKNGIILEYYFTFYPLKEDVLKAIDNAYEIPGYGDFDEIYDLCKKIVIENDVPVLGFAGKCSNTCNNGFISIENIRAYSKFLLTNLCKN